jgi:uncharacterized membrane protein YsdA (DUF1294 family)/cold shock CspA family protein
MLLAGELVDWNDARGFGFIQAEDGLRYFVHITSIARIATRPRSGDRVEFEPYRGEDGRIQARSVKIAGANPLPHKAARRSGASTRTKLEWRLLMALLLTLCAVAAITTGSLPWQVGLIYLVAGALSYLNYADDKRSAEQGRWRISEARLLGVDFCFGIIGGLIGQALLRHKTRKAGYVSTTIVLSGVHLMWLLGLALHLINAVDLLTFIGL